MNRADVCATLSDSGKKQANYRLMPTKPTDRANRNWPNACRLALNNGCKTRQSWRRLKFVYKPNERRLRLDRNYRS